MNTKHFLYSTLLLAGASLFAGCSKEDQPVRSENLGFTQQFAPDANASPVVKDLYGKYGVWVRMDFKDAREVTNAFLHTDEMNFWGATKIDDAQRASAERYAQTLLSNVPEVYTKKFFPLELFFVKTYGGGWRPPQLQRLGRSRLIICWPNKMSGARPITDPEKHYYQDSVLTSAIWAELAVMIADRIPTPVQAIAEAGKAYDNGVAFDKTTADFQIDRDFDKRDSIRNVISVIGGHINGSGSRSFAVDFSQWIPVLATSSAANIKENYLDNSTARARKYQAFLDYFASLGWNIQDAGNKYHQMRN